MRKKSAAVQNKLMDINARAQWGQAALHKQEYNGVQEHLVAIVQHSREATAELEKIQRSQ